jgi:hypothetical protein
MDKKKNIIIVLFIILISVLVFLTVTQNRHEEKYKISHSMIVSHVESLGKLELVRYNIQNIVEYKKLRNWLPNAKTLLVAAGEAVGCIDLAKIEPDDIFIHKDSLSIILPAPEICYCKIDHRKSRIYQVDYGFWETSELVDEAYRHAEEQLYMEVQNSDFEQDTKNNARKILEPIFNAMGFTKISLNFKLKSYNEVLLDSNKININP